MFRLTGLSRFVQIGIVAFVISAVLGTPASAPASAKEASEVVEKLQASLLSVMKRADELGYQGRYRQLAPVVVQSYDVPFLARVSVGKYWKTLNKEQKRALVAEFHRLSVSTYANRLDGYSGETFAVVSQKDLPRGGRLVESLFTKSDGEQLHFNYVLRQRRGRWRIVNVIIDGVSDLALKRAEYTSLMEQEGFSGLIGRIQKQISKYENGQ